MAFLFQPTDIIEGNRSPTFDVLPPSLHVLLEAEAVAAAQPEVFALVSAAPEFSAEVVSVVVSAEFSAEVALEHFEVDNSEHRSLSVLPSIDSHASSSSSVGVLGWESVRSSTGALANYGLCSSLSSPDLYWNRIVEHD
jgi:hypothetical protein